MPTPPELGTAVAWEERALGIASTLNLIISRVAAAEIITRHSQPVRKPKELKVDKLAPKQLLILQTLSVPKAQRTVNRGQKRGNLCLKRRKYPWSPMKLKN